MNDPTLDLRDIKPLVEIPEAAEFTWPLWASVAAVVLALAIAAAVIWFFRNRKLAAQPSARELALARLAELRERELDVDTYVMALSTVLRRYIENRFQIAATQQTTEEFLQNVTTDSIDSCQRSVLWQF